MVRIQFLLVAQSLQGGEFPSCPKRINTSTGYKVANNFQIRAKQSLVLISCKRTKCPHSLVSPQIEQNLVDSGTTGEQLQIMHRHRKVLEQFTVNNSTLVINNRNSKTQITHHICKNSSQQQVSTEMSSWLLPSAAEWVLVELPFRSVRLREIYESKSH